MNPLREGLIKERVPEPNLMVIFGASGDLAKRKIVPALYTLACQRLLPPAFAVIGFSRKEMSEENFREQMHTACDSFSRQRPVDDGVWKTLDQSLFYLSGNYDDPAAYGALKTKLEEIDRRLGIPANRMFYLSTPPSLFPVIVDNLGAAGLVTRDREPWTRVIVEKPFGHDLESARVLNRQLKQHVRETEIFRIDHYLGKETVQNIMALRFANGLFEQFWNRNAVEAVQITAAESLGVEGRGGYFEEAGILRDMVQNHLFQVLCLTGMEAPVSLDPDAVRDEKVKLLKSLRPIPPERMDDFVVRAQYSKGRVLGDLEPGYLEEPDVDPESTTETYVALKLFIDNQRWGGVPFLLRTAKRMPKKVTEISVHFRHSPLMLFANQGTQPVPNVLSFRIQPDEGILLQFGSKVPGPSLDIAQVNMEFRYATSFGNEAPEAYERLILDAMLGDGTLFIRDDETETSWEFISKIHRAWADQGVAKLPDYPCGTWGPVESERLVGEQGLAWRKP